MVRDKALRVRQRAHHERNQPIAVHPEPVEGLLQRFLKLIIEYNVMNVPYNKYCKTTPIWRVKTSSPVSFLLHI